MLPAVAVHGHLQMLCWLLLVGLLRCPICQRPEAMSAAGMTGPGDGVLPWQVGLSPWLLPLATTEEHAGAL